MEQAAGRDNGIVVNNDFAGKLRGITDDTAIANLAVVTDVHILHQQVAVADNSLSLRSRTATDGDILANRVVVANLAGGLLALELQILGFGGDAGTWKELVIVAYAGTKMNGDIVQEFIVVADNNILIDDAEGTDNVVIANLCLRVNDSQWMYLIHARTILIYSNLFVLDNLSSKCCLRNYVVAYEDIAFHRRNAVTNRCQQVDLKDKCVSRNNLLTELDVINLHKVG